MWQIQLVWAPAQLFTYSHYHALIDVVTHRQHLVFLPCQADFTFRVVFVVVLVILPWYVTFVRTLSRHLFSVEHGHTGCAAARDNRWPTRLRCRSPRRLTLRPRRPSRPHRPSPHPDRASSDRNCSPPRARASHRKSPAQTRVFHSFSGGKHPSKHECKMVEVRGAKLASFTVNGNELICLPQVFDLFLKHLVGGLHTVYTKLKRLEITPVVCNVEQVRVLRGLGAIQPGVNRCKLISRKNFEVLYNDCTNAR